jgi:translin
MLPGINEIEKEILGLQDRKDNVMNVSRELIRLTGKCITMMHTGDMKAAGKMLKEVSLMVKKLEKDDAGFEYNSQQAYQEYVEAAVLYSILGKRKIPTDKELGVECIPYLLGLLDVMGELKREVMEKLRKDDSETAEEYYNFMVEIHDSLLPLRFSSSLIMDFRKKQDVGRIQLESVSSELLSFKNRCGGK